jgi:hypothetical protein
MPRSHRYVTSGMPATLERSCPEAQETFTEALRSAITTYGTRDQALRAAYAILKRKFEKRGDVWVAKASSSNSGE